MVALSFVVYRAARAVAKLPVVLTPALLSLRSLCNAFDLSRVAASARVRALALAVVELLAASWTELDRPTVSKTQAVTLQPRVRDRAARQCDRVSPCERTIPMAMYAGRRFVFGLRRFFGSP